LQADPPNGFCPEGVGATLGFHMFSPQKQRIRPSFPGSAINHHSCRYSTSARLPSAQNSWAYYHFTPKHELRAGKMVIHLLTCLTLTAFTSYLVALKLFALEPVPVTADEKIHRVMARAN
jgi:hypothetical protein